MEDLCGDLCAALKTGDQGVKKQATVSIWGWQSHEDEQQSMDDSWEQFVSQKTVDGTN